MKKLLYVLPILLMLVLLSACGQNTPIDNNKTTPSAINSSVSDNDNSTSDFNFTLKYGMGAKNIINTFDGTYEKDLITEGTEETELRFTDEEMQEVYKKMKAINILDYPTDYRPPYSDNPKPGEDRAVEPHQTYILELAINGVTKRITWADLNYSDAAKAKELRDIFIYIDEVIRNKEEYNELPEAVGGYE